MVALTKHQVINTQMLVCKKLTLKHWRKMQAPSLNTWKGLMRYYLTIEKTLANDNNKVEQFNDVQKQIYEALLNMNY